MRFPVTFISYRTVVSSTLVLAFCIATGPALTSCDTSVCKGTVMHQQLLDPKTAKVTVHNNTKTGKAATFCYVTGPVAKLSDCDAGASYPRCAK
jgi:hypothetical protein